MTNQTLIAIQDAYIRRMLSLNVAGRNYAVQLSNAWKAHRALLLAAGCTAAQAEQALYDAADMVVLARLSQVEVAQ